MSIVGELGGQFVAPRTWYGNLYLTVYEDSHRMTERVRQANKRVPLSGEVRQKVTARSLFEVSGLKT